jgi:hypothetical protein
MFCRTCGKNLLDSIKYCNHCGSPSNFFKIKSKSVNTTSKNLDKNRELITSHSYPKSVIPVIPILKHTNEASTPKKFRILVTLILAFMLVFSSFWFFKGLNEANIEDNLNSDNNFELISDATFHIQITSWRIESLGLSSLPDPWIRVFTDGDTYRNTEVWKDSLEWYGDIEFEFEIKDNNNSLGIAIELYNLESESFKNPDVGESRLIDINPNLSGTNAESQRIGFWYNLSDNQENSCISGFTSLSVCEEMVSLSSGLPMHNVIKMSLDGSNDEGTDVIDASISFIVWWESNENLEQEEAFYTADSDGDGTLDYLDYNDEMDVGVTITLEEFGIFSNYDEYMNLEVFINGDSRYLLGQTGDSIIIQSNTMTNFSESFFFDIDDSKEYSIIQFVAYSSGWLFNSNFDLNGNLDDSNILTLYFYSNNGTLSNNYNEGRADGRNDAGSDAVTNAILDYSVVLKDTASLGTLRSFGWFYDSQNYNYDLYLDPDTYYSFKSLDHDLSDESNWPKGYARFTTPDEQYVINLANDLNDMAELEGFTVLETANFILAFVQTIDYKIDNYTNYQGIQEYPKYPIEMLWDGQGDCEDSSALYASLMGALGYDVVLLLFIGDSEGHAAIGISIAGASGKSYSYNANDYYYAETTDIGTLIGLDPAPYFYGLDMSQASYTYEV